MTNKGQREFINIILCLFALPTTIDIKFNSSVEKRNGHLLIDAINDNEQKVFINIIRFYKTLQNFTYIKRKKAYDYCAP